MERDFVVLLVRHSQRVIAPFAKKQIQTNKVRCIEMRTGDNAGLFTLGDEHGLFTVWTDA